MVAILETSAAITCVLVVVCAPFAYHDARRQPAKIAAGILASFLLITVVMADIVYSPPDFDLLGVTILVAGLIYVMADELWKGLVGLARRISIARFLRRG